MLPRSGNTVKQYHRCAVKLWGGILLKLFDDEYRVVAAEAESVVEADLYLGRASLIGNVVQVAGWIGGFVVDGGRHDLVLDGHGAKDSLDGAGGPHDVPRH